MIMQDLRYGFRRLRQSPGFAVVCVLTLALGIGANTAIFTLVDAVMLKSLPVKNPKELYRLGRGDNCCVLGGLQNNWDIYPYTLYQQLRDHTPEFSELAAFQGGLTELSVRRSGSNKPAEPFEGEFVSGNYFSTFGIGTFAGRTIAPADDRPGAAPVAVMGYRAWQEHFGLDPSVIGAAFTINQTPYTIAGIAPPGFFGDRVRPDPPDFWLPLATEPLLNGQNSILNGPGFYWLYIIGRVKPGVQAAGIQPKVTAQLEQWIAIQPDISPQYRAKMGKQQILVTPGWRRRGLYGERDGRGIAAAHDHFRAGAADRLRQYRESAAGARRGHAFGDGHSGGVGRSAPQAAAADSDRERAAGDSGRRGRPRGGVRRQAHDPDGFLPRVALRPHRCRAVAAGAGFCFSAVSGNRRGVRAGAGVADDAIGSGRSFTWGGPLHAGPVIAGAAVAGGAAGGVVRRSVDRGGPTDPDIAQPREPALRVRTAGPAGGAGESGAGRIKAGEAVRALPAAPGAPSADPRRDRRQLFNLQSNARRQLVVRYSRGRPPAR